MTNPCSRAGDRSLCRSPETEDEAWGRRPLETQIQPSNPSLDLENRAKRSIMYRGEVPSYSFRSDLPSPSITPSEAPAAEKDSSIDWMDILGWSLMAGGSVASGLLIDQGLKQDSDAMIASGEAIASSVFMWGLSEIVFRSMGRPHAMRGFRLGMSLGVGAATGIAVGLASKYAGFDFDLEGRQFSDDKAADLPVLFPYFGRPILQNIPTLPHIKLPQTPARDGKNPSSEFGP